MGLKPPLLISVPDSGMAASLKAAPPGAVDAGRVGVVVTAETVGAQKPIAVEAPNGDTTGAVPPRGVMVELADADDVTDIDDDPATGDVGTGDVVTGNVASGEMMGGDAGDGDAIDDDVMDEMTGQLDPAALIPLTGHTVMLPNAGVCDRARLPVYTCTLPRGRPPDPVGNDEPIVVGGADGLIGAPAACDGLVAALDVPMTGGDIEYSPSANAGSAASEIITVEPMSSRAERSIVMDFLIVRRRNMAFGSRRG
jgi:hypothetical protein